MVITVLAGVPIPIKTLGFQSEGKSKAKKRLLEASFRVEYDFNKHFGVYCSPRYSHLASITKTSKTELHMIAFNCGPSGNLTIWKQLRIGIGVAPSLRLIQLSYATAKWMSVTTIGAHAYLSVFLDLQRGFSILINATFGYYSKPLDKKYFFNQPLGNTTTMSIELGLSKSIM